MKACYQVRRSVYVKGKFIKSYVAFIDAKCGGPEYLYYSLGNYSFVDDHIVLWKIKKNM